MSGVYWGLGDSRHSGTSRGMGHHGALRAPRGLGDVEELFWGHQGCRGCQGVLGAGRGL